METKDCGHDDCFFKVSPDDQCGWPPCVMRDCHSKAPAVHIEPTSTPEMREAPEVFMVGASEVQTSDLEWEAPENKTCRFHPNGCIDDGVHPMNATSRHAVIPQKNYLETNTTEYKPHGELTNDFAPEKELLDTLDKIEAGLKAPQKNIAATQQGDEPPKVFPYEGSAFDAPENICTFKKDGFCNCGRQHEAPTDKSWTIEFDERFNIPHWKATGYNLNKVKSFISSLLKKEREKALADEKRTFDFARKLGVTDGKSEAFSLVRKTIEEMKLYMYVDEYVSKVEAWDGKNYDVPFDHGYKQAKTQALLNLSTLEGK